MTGLQDIRDDIPIPITRAPRLMDRKHPQLFALRVGDSYLIEDKIPRQVTSYTHYAQKEARRSEGIIKKFTHQTVRDRYGNLVGTRCWRIK